MRRVPKQIGLNCPAIPSRFSVVDEKDLHEHPQLRQGDECYYIWERMTEVWRNHTYDQYPTNGLISNLQIEPTCENPSRLRYKRPAIEHCADALGVLIPVFWRIAGTFVPIPPSKVKGDSEYDDRLVQVLKAVEPPLKDVREMVVQRHSCPAKQKTITPEQRAANYVIIPEEVQKIPAPRLICVLDDVLAGGSHFKGMQIILRKAFPDAKIRGIFLARTVRPPQGW